jgi:hypothetical protein
MRHFIALSALVLILYACATNYSISEGRFKDNISYTNACCILMRAGFA